MTKLVLPLTGLIAAISSPCAVAQSLVDPVLSTPGTASWGSQATDTGTRTVFTLTGNTILNWSQLNLASGSELAFDFVGGESVVNILNGTGIHTIDGTVTSNGNVSFFSPNAHLLVNGSITAKSVTLATMNVDPSDVLDGGGYTMHAGSGVIRLRINGRVESTSGDVVLAGQHLVTGESSEISANGAVRMGGGLKLSLSQDGSGQQLRESGGTGVVLHLGESRASLIEVNTGGQFINSGKLDSGRVFLEVGEEGRISSESGGFIVSKPVVSSDIDEGNAIRPNEGDAAGAMSSASLKMPALRRPDGSKASTARTVVSNAPVTASGDSGRDRRSSGREMASNRDSKSMMRRASFFGMRGGSKVTKSAQR